VKFSIFISQVLLITLVSVITTTSFAQRPKRGSSVTSYDSQGNKMEATIAKDGSKVTTTIIKLPPILNKKFNIDTIIKDSVVVQIVKAKNRLYVYHKNKFLTAYKCVFGPNVRLPKRMEGDRATPEGWFTIKTVQEHSVWSKFLLIDYPTEESRMKFDSNKIDKLIPANARIGGNVGIHGIWKGGENVIDMKHNWTDGCISIKNADVIELSKIVQEGTKVFIKAQ
jgi:murein L,D-transpeptidase YafK